MNFRWLALVVCLLRISLIGAPPGETQYVLVEGSTFTAGGESPTLPLHGRFRLVRQKSPLDFEVFRVEEVRLESGSSGGVGQIWRGSGRYSFGGRGPILNQQMVLDLTDGTVLVHYDSGPVPVDNKFPELDLVLTGNSSPFPSIHLIAVPELSRQHFHSVEGTTFLDDCAVCGHLPIYVPLTGEFDLVRTDDDPLLRHYHLFDIRFTSGTTPPAIEITGEGTLEIGGEVAIQQRWILQLQVRRGDQLRSVTFTNVDFNPTRTWPMLQVNLAEVGGNFISRFYFALAAAPFREIWFNPAVGFTPGGTNPPVNHVSNADLLSESGRVVIPAADLLNATELTAGVGVDAFDVVPGSDGVVAFSLDQTVTRLGAGQISEGDLLGSNGAIRSRNQELLKRFGFMPPTPDLGLDAVVVRSDGEVWFSVRRSAFSELLGIFVGPGDLLSSRGEVLRSHKSLLARFQPPDPDHDYGLKNIHVWASGEIWFSVEEGFVDKVLGAVSDGDLISDHGYVVFRNLELVRRFSPKENALNFGLRGLFVVADEGLGTVPSSLSISASDSAQFDLRGHGPGRVFQLETTERLDDPFVPVGTISPAPNWKVPPEGSVRFFRLYSW